MKDGLRTFIGFSLFFKEVVHKKGTPSRMAIGFCGGQKALKLFVWPFLLHTALQVSQSHLLVSRLKKGDKRALYSRGHIFKNPCCIEYTLIKCIMLKIQKLIKLMQHNILPILQDFSKVWAKLHKGLENIFREYGKNTVRNAFQIHVFPP